ERGTLGRVLPRAAFATGQRTAQSIFLSRFHPGYGRLATRNGTAIRPGCLAGRTGVAGPSIAQYWLARSLYCSIAGRRAANPPVRLSTSARSRLAGGAGKPVDTRHYPGTHGCLS